MKKIKEWLLAESHFIPVFGVLILIVILSITINLTMQNQDNRQEAASRSPVSIQSNGTDCSNSGGVCVNLASWKANPGSCAGVNISDEYSCSDPALRCCVLAADGSRPGTPGQGNDPNVGGPGTDPGNNNNGQDPNSGSNPGTNPGSQVSPTPRAGSACSVQGGYCSPNGSCGTGYKQASIDGCRDLPYQPCCVPNNSGTQPPTSTPTKTLTPKPQVTNAPAGSACPDGTGNFYCGFNTPDTNCPVCNVSDKSCSNNNYSIASCSSGPACKTNSDCTNKPASCPAGQTGTVTCQIPAGQTYGSCVTTNCR